MLFAYESHLSGVYFTKEFEYPEACNQCGDSDWPLGEFETLKDFIKSQTYENGFCPYDQKYLEEQWNNAS